MSWLLRSFGYPFHFKNSHNWGWILIMNPCGRGFHDAANFFLNFFLEPLYCYSENEEKNTLWKQNNKEKNALPETDWTFVPDKCEDLICPCWKRVSVRLLYGLNYGFCLQTKENWCVYKKQTFFKNNASHFLCYISVISSFQSCPFWTSVLIF